MGKAKQLPADAAILAEVIRRSGKSMREIGKAAGYANPSVSISDYASGRRKMGPRVKTRLEQALDVPDGTLSGQSPLPDTAFARLMQMRVGHVMRVLLAALTIDSPERSGSATLPKRAKGGKR